jgi:hypothetical protein
MPDNPASGPGGARLLCDRVHSAGWSCRPAGNRVGNLPAELIPAVR